MTKFSKTSAALGLALTMIAAPAGADQLDESLKTSYDRGESAQDFFIRERAGALSAPTTTGAIAPRAAFTSAQPVVTLAPQDAWWSSHEAIRRAAEEH